MYKLDPNKKYFIKNIEDLNILYNIFSNNSIFSKII